MVSGVRSSCETLETKSSWATSSARCSCWILSSTVPRTGLGVGEVVERPGDRLHLARPLARRPDVLAPGHLLHDDLELVQRLGDLGRQPPTGPHR